jgi:hypothetical protein
MLSPSKTRRQFYAVRLRDFNTPGADIRDDIAKPSTNLRQRAQSG